MKNWLFFAGIVCSQILQAQCVLLQPDWVSAQLLGNGVSQKKEQVNLKGVKEVKETELFYKDNGEENGQRVTIKKYNPRGNIVEYEKYGLKGTLEANGIFFYNENNQLVTAEYKSGQNIFQTTYQYNAKNIMVGYTSLLNGKRQSERRYEYDGQDVLLKQTELHFQADTLVYGTTISRKKKIIPGQMFVAEMEYVSGDYKNVSLYKFVPDLCENTIAHTRHYANSKEQDYPTIYQYDLNYNLVKTTEISRDWFWELQLNVKEKQPIKPDTFITLVQYKYNAAKLPVEIQKLTQNGEGGLPVPSAKTTMDYDDRGRLVQLREYYRDGKPGKEYRYEYVLY